MLDNLKHVDVITVYFYKTNHLNILSKSRRLEPLVEIENCG